MTSSPVGRVESSEKVDPNFLSAGSYDTHTLHQSESQENAHQLMDDLELLRAERVASQESKDEAAGRSRSKSMHRDRHRPAGTPEDVFDTLTAPVQIPTQAEKKDTVFTKVFKSLRRFPRAIRYFVYAIPVAAVLLTPILLDIYALKNGDNPVGGPGGLQLLWFGIWLEILWVSLWATRIIVATLPFWFGLGAKIVSSSNHKKWKDIGRQMEMPTALFIWMLGQLCSFKGLTDNHRNAGGTWEDGDPPYIAWIDIVWKVIIALFILAVGNWLEKILIQWIAMSFHQRTYSTRIEQNRVNMDFLVQLYDYSKKKLVADDPDWADANGGASGAKTPLKLVQQNAKQAFTKVGKVAGRMAGDFTGRKVMSAGHPRKVVLELMRTQHGSHTLARRIYRTFVRPGAETITPDDLKEAFASPDDAEACFSVFDKDLNGDISMEELELVCNEIHMEKKSIAASLKDLDSVVNKLDGVFLVIIFIIAVIVFISIISGSAAAALGTSGTTILGLSWMLQATAQEFLQSIIFVFVKHPFDVGDRVTVYGNTGSLGTGDDYYVQEISLLYTEFKKMEGHIVQAPNSLLNTLFILNQRRSSGLADPIELKMRFGTSAELVEELKARMTDFVLDNKRDYLPRIISEVRTIDEVYSVTLNVIFFHKSNFQNELLRLQRHNRFAAELQQQMLNLGIQGPRKHTPGGDKDFPFYYAPAVLPPSYSEGSATASDANAANTSGHPLQPMPSGRSRADSHATTTGIAPTAAHASLREMPSQSSFAPTTSDNTTTNNALRRRRAESRARQMERAMPDFGDVFEGRKDPAAVNLARLQALREESAMTTIARTSSHHSGGADRRVSSSGGGERRIAPLGRSGTMAVDGSSRVRRGIFGGRPRSATNAQAEDEKVNVAPERMV